MSMIRRIMKRNRSHSEEKYLSWEEYAYRVEMRDLFLWQQATRKESLRNLFALEQRSS